ncbi:GNAT family N-acetyltransferase [Halorubellus sp. PRR65]|uniref:GNAT family N-acetyltransferase n=1 Tax=Halorubellus sp. PRR65 TaxID=3098148 RepID=UPI002B25CC6D|nr:GNAT family N-acetyltransferase [Halorubellus sp. PRR65]
MHSTVDVRPATFADVPGIRRVAHDAYHAAYGDLVDADALDAQLDEWYSEDGVENRVLRDASTLVVADHPDDGVLGYASAGPSPADDADPPADQATLYTCYVHPDHWDERVGHALLTAIEDALRDREFTHMVVPVLAANDRARQFYADHGYTHSHDDTITFAGATLDEAIHTGDL